MKIIILLAVGFVIFAWLKRPARYADMVATGWGGNRAGNIPTLLRPDTVVGSAGSLFGVPAPRGYGVGAAPVGTPQ